MFGWLRRRPADLVAAPDGLRDLLSSRAAFVSQKCTFEYCRARSGLNWDKLLLEEAFLEAIEACRWTALAAVHADLLVIAEGRMRPHCGAGPAGLVDPLVAMMAHSLARHGCPPSLADPALQAAPQRLALAQVAAPRPAHLVARSAGEAIHRCLPLHPAVTRNDREMVVNSVRFQVTRVFDDLDRMVDWRALAGALVSDG